MKKNNMLYDRVVDYQGFCIANLKYRKSAPAWCRYYDAPQKKSVKHITGNDYHDNAKQLRTFSLRKRGNNNTPKTIAYLLKGELITQKTFMTLVKKQKIKVNKLHLLKNNKKYNVKTLYVIE